MTAHEFARALLVGPDLPILVPRVKEYDFDADDPSEFPVAMEMDGQDSEGNPCRVILIDQKRHE